MLWFWLISLKSILKLIVAEMSAVWFDINDERKTGVIPS